MRYLAVIERAGGNVSAYVPDLPGCVATAADVAAVERGIREAVRFHIDGLRADGASVPEATSLVRYVEASAPGPSDAGATTADGHDPFGAFSEWASPIDDEDYADL